VRLAVTLRKGDKIVKATKKIAEMGIYEAINNMKFGFELEYTKIIRDDDDDDIDWEELGSFQRDSAWDRWKEVVSEAYPDEVVAQIIYLQNDPELMGFSLSDLVLELIDNAIDDWIERQDWDLAPFVKHPDPEDVNCPDMIERVYDGSVPDGGEFRTTNGHTMPECIRLTDEIFDSNDLEITTGCSYHIHVSVCGVSHSYGEQFQAEMLAYLLSRWDRIPATVRHRLLSPRSRRYFEARISTEKYTAIHFHAEREDKPATWEFRLWGNVGDGRDAKDCLKLTAEAIRWAYRVKHKLDVSLIAGMTKTEISGLLNYDDIARHGFDRAKKEVIQRHRFSSRRGAA
jgi:hypothetical protein